MSATSGEALGGGDVGDQHRGSGSRRRRALRQLAVLLVRVGAVLAVTVVLAVPASASPRTVSNDGYVLDTLGHRLDAHDGMILSYRGIFYLFGTAYECSAGAAPQKPEPYCGVKVYWSHNLATWVPAGSYNRYLAFDPKDPTIAAACRSGECYRPHVAYNRHTRTWVMWLNSGFTHTYVVLTSPHITGPYEVASKVTKLGVGTDGYGDETVSVVGDTAWLVYTERIQAASGIERDLVVQRLDTAWTGVAGHAYPTRLNKYVALKSVEAPAFFKRRSKDFPNGLWYLVYSDPSCYYCTGTGTAYATSRFPWGPWTYRGIINPTSCGGQPAAVDVLRGSFVWQVDRWSSHGSQYNARNYLAPLRISGVTGLIPAQTCITDWAFPHA